MSLPQISHLQRPASMLTLRCLLGLIFLMQGYGKVFGWGVENLFNQGFMPYAEHLPVWLLKTTAYYTSYAELIGGLFLILGLFRTVTYMILGSVLLIVSFGHGLMEPIWDLHHVFVRTAFLVPLMLLPASWDRWNLDFFLFRNSQES